MAHLLGGSGNDGGRQIAVDGAGVYVTGQSGAGWGTPVRSYTGGSADAFSAKLTTGGSLSWNTFLGGSGYDSGLGIIVNGNGVYITGTSNPSWYDSIRPWLGLYDAFLSKLNTDGALVDNQFYGAYGDEAGHGIAVDTNGNVYVTGSSFKSWGSPLRSHSGDFDAFVAKLNASGYLEWNTFLGEAGLDYGSGIVVDISGDVYVTGTSETSWSPIGGALPFRDHSGGRDAFVALLTGNGNLVWNTFLGGVNSDEGNGITLDSNKNIYVTGVSFGTWGNPVRGYGGGSSDAFIAKLTQKGFLEWNTFLGGSSLDDGQGIAVDLSENVYVTGNSLSSWGNPVRPYSTLNNAFVAKLNTNGVLMWNTFLGGSDGDFGTGIAVDGTGQVYVTGYSASSWGDPLHSFSGGYNAYIAKLSNGGILLWNTFMGAPGNRNIGTGIAADISGNLYATGYSSVSWGTPLHPFSGAADTFVAWLNNDGVLQWTTFLGGPGWDFGNAITVDSDKNVYVIGSSGVSWGAPIRPFTASFDVFVAKLDKYAIVFLPLLLRQ